MVPGVYDTYLAAMATAAAALIGLLFVAVSVRDDTIFGPNAMPGGEALAIIAFTGLVNSLVVSLLGLIPKVNIGEAAVSMAVISIIAIARLHRRLHTGRNLIVLSVTLLAYAAQFGLGVLLLVDPHDSDQLINLSIIVFVTLIVSLQRAWSLLKGKHLTSAGGTAVTGDHDPPHEPDLGRQQAAASGIGEGPGMSEDPPEAPAPTGVTPERPRHGDRERDIRSVEEDHTAQHRVTRPDEPG
jgi:hypothetical protein